MKKIISLLLALLVLTALFISCDNSGDESSEQASDIESTPTEEVSDEPNIHVEDYGEREFIFATTWGSEGYISEIMFNDEITDSNEFMNQAVNEAIRDRNQATEALLNIKIVEKKMVSGRKGDQFLNYIRSVYLTGSDEAHIIVPSLYDLGTLAAAGELYDINALENIDTSNPWWDQKFNDTLSINGKLFFTLGDIGIYNKNATPIVTFNKKLAEQLISEDLYQLVREGKWTFDKANQFAKLYSEDVDENGIIDYFDNVGWAGQRDDGWNFFFGSGEKIVDVGADGNLRLTMHNERSIDVIDKMNQLFLDTTHYISANDYFAAPYSLSTPTEQGTGQAFIDGRILFFSDNMSFVHRFSVMEDDFGILPVPKYDEQQEGYNSLINPWTGNAFAIPLSLTEEDAEFAAACLDVMGYYSIDTVAKEYVERTLKLQKARDEGSIDMLNIIFNSRGCDFGIIYEVGNSAGASLPFMLHTLISTPTASFTSLYDSYKEAAQSDLDRIIALYNE